MVQPFIYKTVFITMKIILIVKDYTDLFVWEILHELGFAKEQNALCTITETQDKCECLLIIMGSKEKWGRLTWNKENYEPTEESRVQTPGQSVTTERGVWRRSWLIVTGN